MANLRRRIDEMPAEKIRELEADLRTGLLSLAVIAAKYRLHPDALRRFAEKCGWHRGDLRGAIDAAAHRHLSNALSATPSVTLAHPRRHLRPMHARPSRSTARSSPALSNRTRRTSPQGGSRRLDCNESWRRLMVSLVDEGAISGLVTAIHDQNPEMARLLRGGKLPWKERLQLLRECADIVKSISLTQRTYIEMERQAWGLDKTVEHAATYDDFLAELHGEQQAKLVER